jgi:hypothetical protein
LRLQLSCLLLDLLLTPLKIAAAPAGLFNALN